MAALAALYAVSRGLLTACLHQVSANTVDSIRHALANLRADGREESGA
jgi:hypothetical protein